MARLVVVQQQHKHPSFSLLPSSLSSDFNGCRLHSQVQVLTHCLSLPLYLSDNCLCLYFRSVVFHRVVIVKVPTCLSYVLWEVKKMFVCYVNKQHMRCQKNVRYCIALEAWMWFKYFLTSFISCSSRERSCSRKEHYKLPHRVRRRFL